MPADTAEFSAGLLAPQAPVPDIIRSSGARRYAVYRNNVTVGLIRALEANFPAVRALLGEAYFAGFAREFAQRHPPESPLMFEYGSGFPDALAAEKDLGAYPYLADVARLEHLWRASYHAADAPLLNGAALEILSPEALPFARLVPHPAAKLMRSAHAAGTILMMNRGLSAMQAVDPATPEWILITRPRLDVEVRLLDAGAFEFISRLGAGLGFADAADAAAEHDSAFDLLRAMAVLLQSGAFTSILQNGTQVHVE